ncbi:MAG: glycine C-acetyltransferase, partial [Rhodospirillaceae bacterium]|nr:glycine C-acetyltransferase [Rhodospirillaceae bacterium]
MQSLPDRLSAQLDEIAREGLRKDERVLLSPQGPAVTIAAPDGAAAPAARPREVINLCANNYLGLANDPRLVAAAKAALD